MAAHWDPLGSTVPQSEMEQRRMNVESNAQKIAQGYPLARLRWISIFLVVAGIALGVSIIPVTTNGTNPSLVLWLASSGFSIWLVGAIMLIWVIRKTKVLVEYVHIAYARQRGYVYRGPSKRFKELKAKWPAFLKTALRRPKITDEWWGTFGEGDESLPFWVANLRYYVQSGKHERKEENVFVAVQSKNVSPVRYSLIYESISHMFFNAFTKREVQTENKEFNGIYNIQCEDSDKDRVRSLLTPALQQHLVSHSQEGSTHDYQVHRDGSLLVIRQSKPGPVVEDGDSMGNPTIKEVEQADAAFAELEKDIRELIKAGV